MFARFLTAAICGTTLLTATAALADTAPPKPEPTPSAKTDASQDAAIKIGNTLCPVVPPSGLSEKMRAMLQVVSTTCILQATGRISDSEAQSIYEQAAMSLQTSMAILSSLPDDAGVPGSAPAAIASK